MLALAFIVSPAIAQEPAAPDTATLAPEPDETTPSNVIGDTLPVAPGPMEEGAGMPADTTGAAASSTDSTESLEQVREDLEAARSRLDEVQEMLETIPAEDRPPRSPRGAVLRAFALPGWGQFYTGHTFRGFLYGGAEVGFTALGFLQQGDVNDLKQEQTAARLQFVAEQQAANPDTVFTFQDSLALFEQFDRTDPGAGLSSNLETAQKQREDYFTYAIFSVLFAAIDAFVSAHLQPYDVPRPEMRRVRERWEVGIHVPLTVGGGALGRPAAPGAPP